MKAIRHTPPNDGELPGDRSGFGNVLRLRSVESAATLSRHILSSTKSDGFMRLLAISSIALILGVVGGISLQKWFAMNVEESFDDIAIEQKKGRYTGPMIVAVNAQNVKFGEIDNYRTYEHTVKIANGGSKPLTVSLGHSDVELEFVASAYSWPATIPPNSQCHLVARWAINSTDKSFSKEIRFESNDETLPEAVFKIEGTVRKVLEMSKESLEMGAEGNADLLVRCYTTKSLKIDEISLNDAALTEALEVRTVPVDPSDATELGEARSAVKIELKVKNPAKTALSGHLVFKTNIENLDSIKIPISLAAAQE